ncbi:MAG TPA: ATP-dependent helicase [Ignavibacteria bacterium]
MFSHLSEKQLEICNFEKGLVVVKACPGSGKTYSVSARIAKLLLSRNFKRKGIAALSFTNVACNEILSKLDHDFGIKFLIDHPHIITTLDSFINQYIFLPFGHLCMMSIRRPILVGEPYSLWNIQRPFNNYDQYFDKTTFNIDGYLMMISPAQAFHFKWDYYNKKGEVNGHIQNIINTKHHYFKKGFANQSDANFIALMTLERFPLIARNIANLFEYYIIDEAQDTDEIQMKIIETLQKFGTDNIMLIGDRDQAIFEWNNAKPEIFDNKYKEWGKILLDENRRSSQKICNFIRHLSSFEMTESINSAVKTYDFEPLILGYKRKQKKLDDWIVSPTESIQSFDKIMTYFCAICEEHQIPINKQSVAVLYRGNSLSELIRIQKEAFEFNESPWLQNCLHDKNIIKGKHLYENGNFKEGYKLLEKGFIEAIKKQSNNNFYCTNEIIEDFIAEKGGFKNFRTFLFYLINLLPSTFDRLLSEWVVDANENLKAQKIELKIASKNADIKIDSLFGGNLKSDLYPFYFGTVHSVKGKTFEAVLLILGKKAGMNYVNMLSKNLNEIKPEYQEELRIVYVGISRPRKILLLSVPEEDVTQWKSKFLN